MSQADKLLATVQPYIESGPSDQGEYRIRCPLHGERRASASVHPERGWYCQVCEVGGTLKQLVTFIKELPDTDPRKAKSTSANVYDLDSARKEDGPEPSDESLSEAKVLGWHEHLKNDRAALAKLKEKRGLTDETIALYRLGLDSRTGRYTIPVYDLAGRLVNVRRYSMSPGSSAKLWNARGHGSPARLYPSSSLEADVVLVVEGELDALIANQHGFPAVSGTGGAKRWDPTWAKHFAGKRVYISYDNDQEGRLGAKKAAQALKGVAAAVHLLPPLMPDEKSDITDYFLAGNSAEDLRSLMATVQPQADRAPSPMDSSTPASVQVIGSMDSRTNGKPLNMAVTITGRKDPTYSIPHRVALECTMDAGPKCKVCPMMMEWEGDREATIERKDVGTLAEFIDARKSSATDVVRAAFGIQKCNRLKVEELEAFTVEELFVMSSVDSTSHDATDYTQRRIYNVGSNGDSQTNTEARVTGTTVPSPKDRRNEFFSWELEEAVTSLDSFELTPAMVDALRVFQPREGQAPLDRCMDVARDLSANVTKIQGRERLHVAMDLVWHSILSFRFEDKLISRGWLEFLVVGDTRTGKSETAIKLSEHYGLGHVIGCEGATFAGLVGGVKEIGNSRVITWGEITINDRRLVVLDEVSGLRREIIGQMSDVRSRGKAQITKIETATTNARARAIWISNPRTDGGIDDRQGDGIDIIQGLIGNPEDIARFDFAMSVSRNDVPTSVINSPDKPKVPHVFTPELCRDLVLWAWSRRPNQVRFEPDAYRHVFTAAKSLSNTYIEDPPLIQGSNVREKVARLAVALAARTFSTDDGTNVIVTKEHVDGAMAFLNKLYGYDNFGYLRTSKRFMRNRAIARDRRTKVKRYLRENPRLLEFLLDHKGSFRSQDLEEMAHMLRDEVTAILGKLSHDKMISKSKSQIVTEPELRELLKEIEDEASNPPAKKPATKRLPVGARKGK